MKKDSKIRLGKSYAEALFAAAKDKDAEEQVFTDMQKFLQAVESEPDIIKYLANPLWAIADKKAALAEVALKLNLNKISLSCLDVIADNNRFADLKEILEQYENLYYQKNNILKIEVQTALELSDEQDIKLKEALKKLLDKKIVIKYEIRPDILGGLLVQFGSKLIDDSVKSKLERIELLMKGTK